MNSIYHTNIHPPEAYNLEIGLLINFGAKSLELKHLINLIALQKQLLRRPMGSNPAMSEIVVNTIKGQINYDILLLPEHIYHALT